MNTDQVRALLEDGLEDCDIQMAADGNRLDLLLVSTSFDGLNRVKRQQLVYGLLGDLITSGEIHAVMMKTMTPDEAGAANG